MKALFGLTLVIAVGVSTICQAQSFTSQTARPTIPSPTPYAITTQDANFRVWERTVYELDSSGQPIPKKHQYTELASGLNHLVNGQWVESKEQIDILPNGTAVATNGQHQAYFPGDIYNGQIELVTPDGKHLKSRPLALAYFDGTNTAVIAVLTNSIGVVVGNNQVVYPNAFTDFKVDLRYTYKRSGFEQDIILRQQPPTPESLGLNPDTARLQVMTEFFSPPQPTIRSTAMAAQAGLSLTDQSLNFGTMQMVPGRAFLMGTNAVNPKARVSKHWLQVLGRQFLVEEVPVDAILSGLASLPMTAMNTSSNQNAHTASRKLKLPPQRLAQATSKTMLLAQADMPMQGFLLDYQTVSGNLTNVTFKGDTTYYVSGNLNLYGANTFEGGTVIKYYTNGPFVLLTGSVNCQTAPYRPAVFTSKDDDSIGEMISDSTGVPVIDHSLNCYFLDIYNISQVNLHDLRMSYCACGLTIENGNLNLSDVQFFHSDYPVYLVNVAQANVYNALMQDVQVVAFEGFSAAINVKHLTLDNCVHLGENDYTTTMVLTNCLLVGLQSMGDIPYATNYVAVVGTNVPVFQTAAGGNHYLTNNSPYRNAGTINIEPRVLANIQSRTTYPPICYTNVTFSAATTFSPQAQRDTNTTPDLGYHYDPIDYVVGGVDLYTKLTVTNGAVVGWFESIGSVYSSGQGYGISLNNGANLTLQGTATAPCWMVRYDTVQEGSLGTRGWMGGVMLNGSGSGLPQLNAGFTKWAVMPSEAGFRDNWALGASSFVDCEFYDFGIQVYDQSWMVMTNCFSFRGGIYVFGYGQSVIPNVTIQNCLFYDGFMAMARYAGQSPTVWTIKDTAFDGTGFSFTDNLAGNTNYVKMDYNAYNTNNQSGLFYSFPYTPPPTNRLETIGAHDVYVGDYNWQSSWFGNYYQPTNSLLADKGDVAASLLGLYHFTTQTNQVKETNSTVDIGYHYVATDAYGNPLDTNGDGIPDYLEDANGNGIFDSGDLGEWKNSPYGLNSQNKIQVFTPLK